MIGAPYERPQPLTRPSLTGGLPDSRGACFDQRLQTANMKLRKVCPRSSLNYASPIEDHDLVGFTQRRKPVGDQEHCRPSFKRRERCAIWSTPHISASVAPGRAQRRLASTVS